MSQLFEDGKVINVDGVELECVSVSYQETDGARHTFGYTFRPKAELDEERQAEADRQAAIAAEEERIAAESTETTPVVEQTVTQPVVNKEETLDVK